MATENGRDFVPLIREEIVFDIGQNESKVTVEILDDNIPEPDEPFYIELYDPEGEDNIGVVFMLII